MAYAMGYFLSPAARALIAGKFFMDALEGRPPPRALGRKFEGCRAKGRGATFNSAGAGAARLARARNVGRRSDPLKGEIPRLRSG